MTPPEKILRSETARGRRWPAFALALVATAATLALRLAMDAMLGGRPTLVIFTLPIMLSAYVGGLGPGLFATVWSYLAASYYLLPPIHSFAIASTVDRWQQFFFVLCGIVISLLSEVLHRTRRSRAESDELFAKAFRLSPDCVVITRMSDRLVLRANDALCRLWGSTPEEVIGPLTLDYVTWVREDERLAFVETLTSRGECLNHETTLRMADGRLLEFNISSRLITLGGDAGLLTVMRDITERKRVEAAAAQLTSIVESSDDAIIGKTLEGVITSWNSGAEKIFGYSAAEVVGQTMLLLIPPERSAEEANILARITRGEHVEHFETVRVRKDGRRIAVSATISPIADAAGRIVGASKIARDVTVQKAHEHEIDRLSRLYAALSRINQAIVQKRTRDELFAEVCRALVESVGFRMAWVGWLDSETRRVHPVSEFGDTTNFLGDVVITANDEPEGQGATGTAIREGRPYICNSVSSDPRLAPWRQALLAAGHLATATFPIRLSGEICGVVVVSAGEIDLFKHREIALLEEAASDISFALDNFAKEESRVLSEARYRTLFEYAPDGIVIADPQGYYLEANASACRMLGYARDELIRLHSADVVAPAEIPQIEPALSALKTTTDYHREWQLRRKDGSLFPAEVIGTAMPDGNILAMIRDITARKAAEEKLQESTKEVFALKAALDEHAIVAITDPQGKITFVNDKFCAISKYSREELLGRDHRIINSGYHPKEFIRELWTTIRHGKVWHGEIKNQAKDGSFYWVATTIVPFLNDQGQPRQYVAIRADVTVRKNGEEALRATQARLSSTLAAGSIGTWTWDIANDRLIADEFTARAFSVDVDAAAKGLPVAIYLQAVLEEDQPAVAKNLTQAIECCGHYDIEYRVRRKDGKILWLQAKGRVEGDTTGKAANFHGAVMDVTARKLAEAEIHELNASLEKRVTDRTAQLEAANEELRHSRAELNSLFECLPGLYLILTPDLKIVAASDAYLKATLTTREGILGHDLFEVFPDNPGDPDTTAVSNMRASINRVLANAAPDTMAIQRHDVRRSDGVFEERYWSPINSPAFGVDRRIKYVVHRVEEVTDFVRQKVMVAGTTDDLRVRMERMEAEIYQSSQQVKAANQQLEAANKELEAFSYSVSHDLRAPLRAVDGFSQAVIEDFGSTLPADGRRQLQVIRESAQQMGQLIDDLLAFSRLSREPLKKRTVDTDALVREVLGDWQAQIKGRPLEIKRGSLPPCDGDPALLKQVWVNLLSNALKYSSKRARAIVEIGSMEQPDGPVYFVRDNGTGFDMRYAAKLFGVFQRLHRAEEFSGTGVGLAIVQRIVHRHGGRIWAEAEVDRGATFYFTLNPATAP